MTSKGKYNGEWFDDHRHGEGVSVDANNNMYEGRFRFGRRDGTGRLTRCNIDSEGNAKPEILEGVWENDEIVSAQAKEP